MPFLDRLMRSMVGCIFIPHVWRMRRALRENVSNTEIFASAILNGKVQRLGRETLRTITGSPNMFCTIRLSIFSPPGVLTWERHMTWSDSGTMRLYLRKCGPRNRARTFGSFGNSKSDSQARVFFYFVARINIPSIVSSTYTSPRAE